MKINTTELSTKLNKLKDVASKNKIDSAFSGILLENGTALATNALYSMRLEIEEAHGDPVIIPISAVDLISNLPAGETDLTVTGEMLTISSGKIRAQFTTRPAGDYPKYGTVKGMQSIDLKWREFSESLSKVLFACAKVNNNPAFTGVHLFTTEACLHMVACDTYRLAWEKVTRTWEPEIDCVIHKEILSKLISVYDGETVQLTIGKSNALFSGDGVEFYARLADGQYPDIMKIIPEYKNLCRLDVSDALLMLRRISPLCQNIVLDAAENSMKVTGRFSTGLGSIDDNLDLCQRLPHPVKIGFSTNYLTDAFKAFRNEDTVGIGFSDEESASIRPMVLKAGSMLCMCIPVRIGA